VIKIETGDNWAKVHKEDIVPLFVAERGEEVDLRDIDADINDMYGYINADGKIIIDDYKDVFIMRGGIIDNAFLPSILTDADRKGIADEMFEDAVYVSKRIYVYLYNLLKKKLMAIGGKEVVENDFIKAYKKELKDYAIIELSRNCWTISSLALIFDTTEKYIKAVIKHFEEMGV
jgi:hypothetical protein